ncbi:divergent polysaccharide deacetylase family protein [Parvularcula sp. ZS-1/3]|uniref:Divergent polysaccharide deacetylase family protein n=1 Tax=Parvularcula mediterranea TaxID=2732508 RepID=A0A7Y3W6H2_9PROT|nr:divergent polysaccharide deacetylase family protein [Parvularcula mediterranea]NNU17724.1 divergent polysaccharide deacetylase family protein [Parvularcula mediterranea]
MAARKSKNRGLALAALSAILLLAAPGKAEDLREGVPLRLPEKVDERPLIAIVIDDVGLDWERFRAVNRLPFPATVAFLPYGAEAQGMLDALDPRHEAILHLPMEPKRRREDAGPDMVPARPGSETRRLTVRNLGKLEGYSGVNNHTGSLATESTAAMRVVMAETRTRGLYFLDSKTSPRSVAYREGKRLGARVVEADLFLDGDFGRRGAEHVERQLGMLEQTAEVRGYAVGIGHPYPSTISALNAWAEAKGEAYRFVLVSALASAGAADDGS